MSTPIVPCSIAIYKIVRENEKLGKTQFTIDEIHNYINKVINLSAEYGDEQYFAVMSGEYAEQFYETLEKICDIHDEQIEINENKFDTKNKRWCDRGIGGIVYPLLICCIKTLKEEFKEKEEIGEIQCD